jgi:peroxiredoxin
MSNEVNFAKNLHMDRIKSIFIFLYCSYLVYGLVTSVAGFTQNTEAVGWYAAVLTHLAGIFWFAHLYLTKHRNSNILILVMTVFSGIAFMIAFGQFKVEGTVGPEVVWLTGAAFVGWLMYTYWYSKMGKLSLNLKPGDLLPQMSFTQTDGNELLVNDLANKKLIVFHRGNWCPFCVAQLEELSSSFDKLDVHQIDVVAVSPQEDKFNERLSKKWNVPYFFVRDAGLRVSKSIGLSRKHSLPLGLQVFGYDSDLIAPASILVGSDNKIIAVHQSSDYRKRPDTSYFLRYLK